MKKAKIAERSVLLRDAKLHKQVNKIGNILVEGFHLLGLFAIGAATVWAAVHSFIDLLGKDFASIEDILLLFIYLEIGAMVGIYFKTNHMPVRYLIYIAITALTRHLVVFVNSHHTPEIDLLIAAAAIFVLALTILVIRFGSNTFPSLKTGSVEKNE